MPKIRPATKEELKKLKERDELARAMEPHLRAAAKRAGLPMKKGKNPYELTFPPKKGSEHPEANEVPQILQSSRDLYLDSEESEEAEKIMETNLKDRKRTPRIIVITAIVTLAIVGLIAFVYILLSKKSPDVIGQNTENSVTQEKSKEQLQLEREQDEREKMFAKFQGFVDKHHPRWKVVGINEQDSNFYYLLLSNGSIDKTIFVMISDFQSVSGEITSHIYEPSERSLKKRKWQLIKNDVTDQVREEDEEAAAEAEAAASDYYEQRDY